MSFARKSLFLSMTTYLVLALGLVHVVVLSRALGPEGVGQVTLFRQTFVLAAQLALLGLPMAMINRLRREVAEPSALLASVCLVSCGMSVLASVVVIIILITTEGRFYSEVNGLVLLSACLWVPTLMQRAVLYHFLLGRLHVRAIAILDLSPPLILACFYVMAWWLWELDVTTVVLAEAMTVGVISCLFAALLVKPWRVIAKRSTPDRKRWDRSLIREMLPDGLMMSSSSVLLLLLAFLSLLVLRLMIDDAEVGIYSRGLRLATLLALGVQSVQRLFYSNWSGMEPERRARSVEKTINITLTLAVIGGAGLIILARPLVLLLFGSAFSEAVSVTRIAFGGVLFFLIVRTLQSLFNADNRPYLSMLVLGVGVLANVLLLLLLVPRLGADGAAWAYLLCMLAMACIALWFAVSRYQLGLRAMLIPDPRLMGQLFKQLRGRRGKSTDAGKE